MTIGCSDGNCSVVIGDSDVNIWASFEAEANLGLLGTFNYTKNLGGISDKIDDLGVLKFKSPL
jgi:hypothetical protein